MWIKKYLALALTLVVVSISALQRGEEWRQTRTEPFQFVHDTDQYYSYLPAAFIHKDLTFSFPNNYWLVENQKGISMPRSTMGMSYMYAPFFFIGHAIANLSDTHDANGYSLPYSLSIWYGSVIYFIIGAVFLYFALIRYVNHWLAAFVILLIFYGTNLLHYTFVEGAMTHVYLFAVFSAFIYFTIKWHDNYKSKHLYVLALLYGLSIMIRQSEIFLILFFLFFGVYDLNSAKGKLQLLLKHKKEFFFAFLIFLLPIIPQIIFWRVYGGVWLMYYYAEEGFFFLDPKIYDFLFSYRKGWFVYTPIMLVAMIGVLCLKNKWKSLQAPIVILIVVSIYFLSSWWTWWFGGGLGMRAMIQYYCFLAFPLAALLEWSFNRKWTLSFILPIVLAFGYFGYLNNHKYRHSTIHWDSMSKEAFWFTFGKKHFKAEDHEKMEKLLDPPDYEAALTGNR